MPTLRLSSPDGVQTSHPLIRRVISVGPGPENDVCLPGAAGLPETALTLTRDGPSYELQALGGASITIAGKKSSRAELSVGDAFEIGGWRLQLVPTEALTPAPPPTRRSGSDAAGLLPLFDFSQRLMGDYELPHLLNSMMDAVIEVTGADKGFLLLAEGDALSVQVARNLNQETIAEAVERMSDTIVAKVARERRPLIVSDALNDSAFKASESVVNLKLCSVMCVPLLDRGALLGLIYVGNDSVVDLFEAHDLDLLTVFAGQAALILANARLVGGLRADKEQLQAALERRRFGEMIGACDAMQVVFRTIEKVAATDVSVLVGGETGTGKELVAREIHQRSPRADGPFIAVNCGAIPEQLLESELFGHVKGAFTGAVATREGRFQAAHNGTLFLDELAELPLNLQVKLLRALQERTVTKVGDTKPEQVNIRVVAATHRELLSEIEAGRFREDLYYRVNVISLVLPPLHSRGEDVVVIARYLLARFAEEMGVGRRRFTASAENALRRYRWPGNIRELENRIRKALVLAEGPTLRPEDLDLGEDQANQTLSLQEAVEHFKLDYINKILARNNGNRTRTARELAVDPRTIFRHLERQGDAKGPKASEP